MTFKPQHEHGDSILLFSVSTRSFTFLSRFLCYPRRRNYHYTALIYLITSVFNPFWALVISGRKGPIPASCRVSNTAFDRSVTSRWLQHQPWMTFRAFHPSQNTNSLRFRPCFLQSLTSSLLSFYPLPRTGASPCSSIGLTPRITFRNTDYTHRPKSQSGIVSRDGRLSEMFLYSRSCKRP